jgi:uncharacterized cupin superfamily protein
MKPFTNLDEISDFQAHGEGSFQEKYAVVGEKIGAQKLGYSVTILTPGKKVCPFHNHRIYEEMFLILEGSGTLRYGETEYAIKRNDIIACPSGGPEVAHQIINTSNAELKYLCLSTNEPADICEYPDSNKLMSWVGGAGKQEFKHISRLEDEVDYYLDEK